ncbi:MAG: class I SAM-dependent methyltransferase [Bacteroidota bacterium]|nr:class I SAM-dependent methyltransferase [Bacteroidota bacterium]
MTRYPYTLTPGGPELVRNLFAAMAGCTPRRATGSCLYLRCRYGENVFSLAEVFPGNILATDEDPEALLFCRTHASAFGGRVSFRTMSFDALEAEDSSMDFIIIDGVPLDLPASSLLQECRRVLKPAGIIGAATPFWKKEPVPVSIRELWETKTNPVPTEERLRSLFPRHGFSEPTLRDASHTLQPFYRQFLKETERIAERGFAGFERHKALIKRFKHETHVYLRGQGKSFMGYMTLHARNVPALTAEG